MHGQKQRHGGGEIRRDSQTDGRDGAAGGSEKCWSLSRDLGRR